ncbi:MAG: hypothetical protein JWO78_887 [Micavibrio sp.]|nr:hypothetical protein [Micavibrio sp.]
MLLCLVKRMAQLLTMNGIPPQLIGEFSAAQQRTMTEYGQKTYGTVQRRPPERYEHPSYPDALQPFGQRTSDIVECFKAWGAVVQMQVISLWINNLSKGEATFSGDFNLHADSAGATEELLRENTLYLRTLGVSTDPADFISLTDRPDMRNIFGRYKNPDGNPRIFHPDLMQEARDLEAVVTPERWSMILFDGATPHLPKGAAQANQRILMSGWIEIGLPPDWKARIKNNDSPQWNP